MAAALAKRHYKFLLFMYLLYFIQDTFEVIATSESRWSYHANTFRFTSLKTRSGSNATNLGISSFGLLRRGCHVDNTDASYTQEGASMTLTFDNPVKMDGW